MSRFTYGHPVGVEIDDRIEYVQSRSGGWVWLKGHERHVYGNRDRTVRYGKPTGPAWPTVEAAAEFIKRETANPDDFVHAFRTFAGIPPSKGIDNPVCGAVLTDAYDGRPDRPLCPACEAIISKGESS